MEYSNNYNDQASAINQQELSIFTEYQDHTKDQILRQVRDLEHFTNWQIYDAHEAATIFTDRATTNKFLQTGRFDFKKGL